MQRVIGKKARPAPGRGGKPGISRAHAIAIGLFSAEYELQHVIAGIAMRNRCTVEQAKVTVKRMVDIIGDNMRLEAEKSDGPKAA